MKEARQEPHFEPGASAWEPHSHKCRECGTVWFHDPVDTMDAGCKLAEKTGNDADGNELLKKAHDCPACGFNEHWTYGGTDPVSCIHNGIVTKPIAALPTITDDEERKQKRFLMMLHCKMGI